MKFSRLWIYAAIGMITGLLLENKTLTMKQAADEKARKLKKEAEKLLPNHS